MKNQLTSLYLVLGDFVEPLRRSMSSPEALEHLFHRYGWVAPTDLAVFEHIRETLSVVAAIEEFLATAEPLQQTLDENPDAALDAGDIAALLEVAEPLLRALAEFELPDPTDLAEPFGRPDFWESISEHLLDDLLEQYLRIYHPGIFLVLRLWGALRYEPTRPTEPFRKPYTRISLDWERVLDMLTEPLASLKQAYHWDDPAHAFDHQAAFDALAMVLRAMRLPTVPVTSSVETEQRFAPDPARRIQQDVSALRTILLQGASFLDQSQYKLGFEVFPAARADQPDPSGLMIKPLLQGSAAQEIPLGDRLSLHWSIAADQGDRIGFALFPRVAELIGGAPAVGTRLEIASTNGGPWYPVGNARTSRIELSGFAVSFGLEGSVADPEIKLRVAAGGEAGDAGGKVVILLEDADPFVSQAVDRSSLEFSFSPEVLWSSKTGLTFNGNKNLEVNVPVHIDLGPVTLTDASITIIEGPPENGVASSALHAGVGIQGTLGPVAFVVEKLGFTFSVARHTRQDITAAPVGADLPVLGGLDVDLSFAPPDGVGLLIDAGSVVGAGYLFFDPEKEQYAGSLRLEFNGIALNAVGLLTTRLPDGSDGFSLLVSISSEDFTPIRLGFGFTLKGVGGLLGVNRTAVVDVLRAGIKNRSLNSVLFPEDPVRNAPQIISDLRAVFPAARDRYVFGPVAIIGWGTPTALTIELGLVLEFPQPVRLIALGQFRALLPSEDRALIRLQMDALGLVDFDKGEASVDATLYDSRIAHYAVSGDMALRSRWSTDPTFVLAVGGFNPRFQPPPGFPALKRLAVSLTTGDDPRLRLEAYLALTSNTAQVGARLDLYVGAAGFSIEGYLGFDALFGFAPFQFVADLGGGVTLKWHGHTLAGVQLEMTLSGPSPVHARGKATFEIWRFSKSVDFDKTIGEGQPPPALPPADPLPDLVRALADARNWSAQLPGPGRTLVSLREIPATSEVLAHPLGDLTVRQRVVPLNIEISRYGNTTPSGDRRFTLSGTRPSGNGSADLQPVTDYFAPAQFFEMTESEKLARPSFERLDAGVRIGTEDVTYGGKEEPDLMTSASIGYETRIVDPDDGAARGAEPYTVPTQALEALADLEVAGRSPAARMGRAKYRAPGPAITLGDPNYVVARTEDLASADIAGTGGDAEGLSYMAAVAALRNHLAGHPEEHGRLQIVATHEAAEVAP